MLNEPKAGDIWSYWWSAHDRRFYLLIEQRGKADSHQQDWHVINLEDGSMSLMGFGIHLDCYWRKEA